MNIKTLKKQFVVFLLLISLCTIIFVGFIPLDAADACEINIGSFTDIGLNFIREQYSFNNIDYQNVEIFNEINVYNLKEIVVAIIIIFKRDDNFDYCIIDLYKDEISSFGFNSDLYLSQIYGQHKLLYWYNNNFVYEYGNNYIDIYGNTIKAEEYCKVANSFIPKAVTSGYDGLSSWDKVVEDNRHGSISNGTSSFIQGFSQNEILYYNGTKPVFYGQEVFNEKYKQEFGEAITGTCGPTAMTNMAIYYDWRKNGKLTINDYEVFKEFIITTNWNNWSVSSWWNNTCNSLLDYGVREISPNSKIVTDANGSLGFLLAGIDSNTPLYYYINVEETSGNIWAHAVVAVGYQEFVQSHYVNNRWWFFGWHDKWEQVIDGNYYYIRVIDGWSSSNEAIYVKYNFYDKHSFIGLTL